LRTEYTNPCPTPERRAGRQGGGRRIGVERKARGVAGESQGLAAQGIGEGLELCARGRVEIAVATDLPNQRGGLGQRQGGRSELVCPEPALGLHVERLGQSLVRQPVEAAHELLQAFVVDGVALFGERSLEILFVLHLQRRTAGEEAGQEEDELGGVSSQNRILPRNAKTTALCAARRPPGFMMYCRSGVSASHGSACQR
jgi:hypothetical protein